MGLEELIKTVSNATGKSFILGKGIKRFRATVYAPRAVTQGEAYAMFLSVLRLNRLTVIHSGKHFKIVPIKRVSALGTPVLKDHQNTESDRIITELIPARHMRAEELNRVLTRFKSKNGEIELYLPMNTLVVTDFDSSIQRMKQIIAVLDVPLSGKQIWIEPINHADASELAELISKVLDLDKKKHKIKKKRPRRRKKRRRRPARPPSPAVIGDKSAGRYDARLLADERINAIIIVASKRSYIKILKLIEQLDTSIAGFGKLHVYQLKHAKASTVVKALGKLVKDTRTSRRKKRKRKRKTTSVLVGEVQLTADEETNSLLIVSNAKDYLLLEPAIEKLDAEPRQVFIEAVVMEVGVEKARALGVGLHGARPARVGDSRSLFYGASRPNEELDTTMLSPSTMSGLAAGIRGPSLSDTGDLLGVGMSLPSFGLALEALQTNSDVDVLSTPYLLAMDNEASEISVGENIPIQTSYNFVGALLAGQTSGKAPAAGANVTPASGAHAFGSSFRRKNVGLTLGITPHTSYENQIRLEIEIEISGLKSVDTTQGATISKKKVETVLIVSDQHTAVIGGLLADDAVETTKKVPVLGDIPVLGWLFRHKSTISRKQNLLIFLTPYIVRDADDLRRIFKRKMAERNAFVERRTAFESRRVSPRIDWSRTNGLVSEIDQTIRRAQIEAALTARATDFGVTPHVAKPSVMDFGRSKKRQWTSSEIQ